MGLRVCHHLRAHTHTHTYSKELHINSVQQQQQSSPAATCLPSSAINHWIPSALRCELEEWGEEGVEGSIPELDVVIPLMLCKWRMCLNPRCPTQLLLMLLLFSKPDRFQEPGRKKKHMPGWQDRWTVMGFVRFVKHTLRAARHKCQPCVKQHQCDTWAVPPVHQSSNQLWCNLSIASLINCDKSASCDLDWQLSDWLISTDESSVNHSCVYMHLCCPADHDPGTWCVLFCSKHLSTLWPLVGISVVWFPLRQRTYLAVLLLFMPTLSYFMNKPQVFIIILIIKDIQNIKEHK